MELKNFLSDPKSYIKNNLLTTDGRLNRSWRKYLQEEIREYLTSLYKSEDIKMIIYCVMHDLDTIPLCQNCGKNVLYPKNMYCSTTCRTSSQEMKDRRNQTFIKRYGSKTPFNTKEAREKRDKTNLDRYGVKNPLSRKDVRDRIKKSNLKKYGVENVFQRKDIKEHIKKQHLERYGVGHSLQRKEIQEERKKKHLERYGVEHPSQRKEVQQKIANKKHIETFKKYNLDWDLFNNREYLLSVIDIDKDTLCSLSEGIFNGCPVDVVRHILLRNNIRMNKKSGTSRGEVELHEFLVDLGFNDVILNTRSMIRPYELDIVVPSKNFAIEYNGLYWHSSNLKSPSYHLMKTELARKNNIDLFHIFEDEWREKKDIVKSMIKTRLGLTMNKIHARNCYVRLIKNPKDFLDDNHLQGYINGTYYGLYYNDVLVSAIGIGSPRFNKNYSWELLRFCNKLDHIVVGGFSKLLAFIKNNITHDDKILTYADRRYSNGNLYRKFGKELPPSRPGYFWISEEYNDRVPRYKTMKHKLEKFLGTENFDPSLSERENMELNGFYKIYDCGNLVFEL